MLSAEENALLTRTGPGTPMGDLMRQYWIPALMSSDLHMGSVSPDDLLPGTFDYYTVNDRTPQYKVVDTEWGTKLKHLSAVSRFERN